MERILITGANGLIGRSLTPVLLANGYQVVHLLRRPPEESTIPYQLWDPGKGICAASVFDGIDHVIHLAGENIGAKRWTEKRKKAIRDSRVKSAELLFARSENAKLKTFVSASGISIYGTLTSDHIFSEDDQPANDFLANVTVDWERAADQFLARKIRVVKIRTAPVLSADDGVLQKMAAPVKFGFGAVMGTGKQYFPWIHIDDICGIYLKAIRDNAMHGAYNAVAPEHCNNETFTYALAGQLKRKIRLPKVPAFVLKIMFGKMGELILKGSRVSSDKIRNAGYVFRFLTLTEALRDVFSTNKH